MLSLNVCRKNPFGSKNVSFTYSSLQKPLLMPYYKDFVDDDYILIYYYNTILWDIFNTLRTTIHMIIFEKTSYKSIKILQNVWRGLLFACHDQSIKFPYFTVRFSDWNSTQPASDNIWIKAQNFTCWEIELLQL